MESDYQRQDPSGGDLFPELGGINMRRVISPRYTPRHTDPAAGEPRTAYDSQNHRAGQGRLGGLEGKWRGGQGVKAYPMTNEDMGAMAASEVDGIPRRMCLTSGDKQRGV